MREVQGYSTTVNDIAAIFKMHTALVTGSMLRCLSLLWAYQNTDSEHSSQGRYPVRKG